MLGSFVAHYRITGKIGEGAMGVVYKAEDTKLRRIVALKFLNTASAHETASARFLQEARAAAGIQHPNICPIFEINQHESRPFFAMAYVEGKTLSQLLETGPLPLSKALDIAIQIANGLDAAHSHGVVHRDIKSGNIIVGIDGHVTILDFGLAQVPNADRLTTPGTTSGTVAYMSPEQAQGLDLDRRSDVWSLGVVLFEMLTGALPFERENIFSVMYAIVNQEPAPAPKAIEAILTKALAKDPSHRFQSAAELGVALRHIRDAQSRQTQTVTSFQTPVQAPPPLVPTKRRPAWNWVAAASVLALLAAIGGYFAFHKPLPKEKEIAVLPFNVVDKNDQALRALADGLVETLTAKLSQVEDFQGKLTVIPASETRSRNINSPDDARRIYGATLAITGSVARLGDRVEFNEALVDTEKQSQLSADSFDFTLSQALEIRDRAVKGVMHMLQVKLLPVTANALDEGETKSPEAYTDYLKGVGYLARFDVEGNVDRAIGSLQNAISADPNYALAYSALGEAHWTKATLTPNKQEADAALDNIKHALSLDSRLAVAHIKLGQIYSESGKPDLAIEEEKNALQIAPHSAQAYQVLGAADEATGKFGDAENAYKKSIELQPTDWLGNLLLGYFYVQRGRLTEARAAYDNARSLTPDNEIVLRNIGALDLREGKFSDAVTLVSKASKPDARTEAVLGLAYYYQQQFKDAAAAFESSIKLSHDVYLVWGNLGSVYRHLPGSEDKARPAFLKAIDLANQTLEVQPGNVRAHANLAEYYAKVGQPQKAMNEIAQIPESARSQFLDRIALVYLFSGDKQKAAEIAHSVPQNSPVVIAIKYDPDLHQFWQKN